MCLSSLVVMQFTVQSTLNIKTTFENSCDSGRNTIRNAIWTKMEKMWS